MARQTRSRSKIRAASPTRKRNTSKGGNEKKYSAVNQVTEVKTSTRSRSSTRGRGGSNKIIATSPNELPFPEIYWGGCAFGSAFYVGVYKALWEKYDFPSMLANGLTMSGGSAGAIFAMYIALGYTPDDMDGIFRAIIADTPARAPWHSLWANHGASMAMESYLRKDFKKDPTMYKRIEGKVAIGTTQWYSNHAWHVSWEDNDDLMLTISGSYHVPFYCHRNRPIKGVHCLDGAYGFAGTDLKHGDATLYIGIDPHAEITRHFDYSEMFFPPQGADYDDMVQTGYDAATSWFEKGAKHNKKVGVKGGPAYRTPNWEALRFLWVAKLVELVVYYYNVHFLVLVLVLWQLNSHFTGGGDRPCCAHHHLH